MSDGAFIEPGQQVKVLAIHGNRIVVAEVVDDDLGETKHHGNKA